MSKPASHLRGQQLCPVDQDMSENLFPDLGPQRARAPGPFSSEVQTKVEWKGLQEQEHSEGQPQAKTLFLFWQGRVNGRDVSCYHFEDSDRQFRDKGETPPSTAALKT